MGMGEHLLWVPNFLRISGLVMRHDNYTSPHDISLGMTRGRVTINILLS